MPIDAGRGGRQACPITADNRYLPDAWKASVRPVQDLKPTYEPPRGAADLDVRSDGIGPARVAWDAVPPAGTHASLERRGRPEFTTFDTAWAVALAAYRASVSWAARHSCLHIGRPIPTSHPAFDEQGVYENLRNVHLYTIFGRVAQPGELSDCPSTTSIRTVASPGTVGAAPQTETETEAITTCRLCMCLSDGDDRISVDSHIMIKLLS
jgi:hypothetical protein